MTSITKAFRSEWVKLSRPGLLAGCIGPMVALVALATFGMMRVASLQVEGRRPNAGFARVLSEGSGGWLVGLEAATSMLGVIALVTFASNIGGEYKNATLRSLLAIEPRRLQLLAGKLLALCSLTAAAVAIAIVVAGISSVGFGNAFGVETSSWLSGSGLAKAMPAYLNVTLACIGWGIVGGFLAITLRTSAAAIGIGIGYLVVGEPILARAVIAPVLDAQAAWFPGEVLRAFAMGGNGSSSYLRAALLALLYVGAFGAIAGALFRRRDVLT